VLRRQDRINEPGWIKVDDLIIATLTPSFGCSLTFTLLETRGTPSRFHDTELHENKEILGTL
jgi:hypothetical protein